VAARNSNIANLVEKHGRSASVTFIDEPEPEELFCPLISVDDHVLEPPTVFQGRMPAKFADLAPRVDYDDTEVPWWIVDGKRLPILFPNGAAGRVMGEWKGGSRCKYDEFRLSVSDPVARLKDMDLTGVWASLCFGSTVWGFAGTRFSRIKDPELGYAALQAYNDWMIEDWCEPSGGVLIPLCLIPLWDVDLAAAEVRRNAERGARAVCFSEIPVHLGLPSIHTGEWDPFFAACNETNTTVCMHIGSSSKMPATSADAPPSVAILLSCNNSMASLADFLFSGVLVRFPELKLAYSEGQIGWIPYALERADNTWKFHSSWTDADEKIPEPPSTYYKGRVFGCFTNDVHGVESIEQVGEDNICFETDYPHTDTTWPFVQQEVDRMTAGLTDEQRYKVLRGNAIRMLDLDRV
jgi:predicted TIM-barrel fold metal-dependent hydrolase